MNLYFLYPRLLYLLLIVPVIILFYFFSEIFGKRKAILFSNFEALERISGVEFFSKSFLVLFFDVLLIILLIFSMAQLNVNYMARTDSFSHVFLIDSSGSMSVKDLGISRLDMGKRVAKEFVNSLPFGVEFGVISFSGEPNIIQRIDGSRIKTLSSIDATSPSSIDGTNLYNAVLLSDGLFSDQRKSIILISDGEFSVFNVSEVIKYSLDKDIVINSIVIGTSRGGLDEFGVVHKINIDVMRALAFNTGGKFFEVNSEVLPENFKDIFVETNREINTDLTFYLLISSLVVFLLNWSLKNFRLRFFPN